MLLSLALILIFGLLIGFIFSKIHLPSLLGMLIVGIVLGPFVLNLIDPSILNISASLRKIALIIILIKAGLTLDFKELKKVGRPAILLCFVPATFEILAFVLIGPSLLNISYLEAGIIGAILGAVSPAIIVPKMSKMIEEKWGTDKSIPQMIIAGASADDVYVIVLFTSLCSLEKSGTFEAIDFAQIPISVVLGVGLGIVCGLLLSTLFKKVHMRDTLKIIILIGVSFALVSLEDALTGQIVTISGLLAIMAMGMAIYTKNNVVASRLSNKFSKLWLAAEIILFVLVGASVNITFLAGSPIELLKIVAMIFIGLAFRLFGTYLCLIKTKLLLKERIFVLLAEIPKATVQAAIGGIPLAMGLRSGNLALTVAVLSILICAPVGAIAIDLTYKRLLNKESINI